MYSACWFITCWKESSVSKFRDTDVSLSENTDCLYSIFEVSLSSQTPPHLAYPSGFASNYQSISWLGHEFNPSYAGVKLRISLGMLWIYWQSWYRGLAPASKVWHDFGAGWLGPDVRFGEIWVSGESTDTKVFPTFFFCLLNVSPLPEFPKIFSKIDRALTSSQCLSHSFMLQAQVPAADTQIWVQIFLQVFLTWVPQVQSQHGSAEPSMPENFPGP